MPNTRPTRCPAFATGNPSAELPNASIQNGNPTMQIHASVFATAFLAALPAFSAAQVAAPAAALRASDDIVDTAAAAGQFGTLLAAAKAAGLVDALRGDGPLTVFAPTDDAFDALPAGTVAGLLKPENKGKLQTILKYHVVAGSVPAAKVVESTQLSSLADLSLVVHASEAGVTIGGANVVKTDIECSNGIIHVVDSVMLPATIVGIAQQCGTFDTLLAAAKAAGLAEALAGDGPLTVFAPTDEAFAKLPEGTVANLLKPENKSKLQAILKYHVVSGAVDARTAVGAGEATTLQGGKVSIGIRDGRVTVDGAGVVMSDVRVSNGIVHVIDSVILPN